MADELLTGYIAGQSDSNSNNGMWGDGSWIFSIIILGMIFGWGNGGFGGWGSNGGGLGSPSGQGWATRADINEGFALNNLQSGITAIQQGICDSTYALNNGLTNGFHDVDTAVCNLGYQNQTGFNSLASQLASCCCETQSAIQGVRYDMATSAAATQNTIQNTTRDLLDNNNANTRAILDALTAQRIEAKDEKIAAQNQQIFQLQLAASQQAQNAYLTANQEAQTAELIRRIAPAPVPSYAVPAPYPFCGSAYSACGCGC